MKFWHFAILLLGVVAISGCQLGGPTTTSIPTTTLSPMQYCNSLIDISEKDYCFIELAEDTERESTCSLVSVDLWRDNCLRRVAVSKVDPSLCDSINDSYEFNECLKQVAKEAKNETLCDGIKEATSKDECYYTVALDTKMNETCDKVVQNNSRLRCLAIINKNPEYCAVIDTQRGVDWCYNKILACDYITADNIKDDCFRVLAPKNLNATICNLVSNESVRQGCITDVEKMKERLTKLQTGTGLDNETFGIEPSEL